MKKWTFNSLIELFYINNVSSLGLITCIPLGIIQFGKLAFQLIQEDRINEFYVIIILFTLFLIFPIAVLFGWKHISTILLAPDNIEFSYWKSGKIRNLKLAKENIESMHFRFLITEIHWRLGVGYNILTTINIKDKNNINYTIYDKVFTNHLLKDLPLTKCLLELTKELPNTNYEIISNGKNEIFKKIDKIAIILLIGLLLTIIFCIFI